MKNDNNTYGTIKIGDFGFARSLDNAVNVANTYLGSPLTMAPEIAEKKAYTYKVDIYSLGVIFYQMLFGDYPYKFIDGVH